MINEGLVQEHSSYIKGGKQHQKVYFLTSKGRAAAGWMRDNPKDQLSGQDKRANRNASWTNLKTSAAAMKKTWRISRR